MRSTDDRAMFEESIDRHTRSMNQTPDAENGSTADGNDQAVSSSASSCAVHLHDSQSLPKSRRRKNFGIAVVSVVIAVVWVSLALPTILYHLPQTDACIPEIYTGSICREALLTQQNCLLDDNATGDVFIAMDPASSQFAKEEQASLFIGGLSFLAPSPECMEEAVPFLCFYFFPLCDSSGRPYQPSSTECREITDSVCAREFETVASFTEEDQLPQCQLLPETTSPVECNATESTFANSGDLELGRNSNLSTTRERVCSEGFYTDENTGLCMPECGVSEEFPDNTVVIFSAVIGLLGGVVVLVFSCISYKRMFSFPAIFIVYSVIALVVLEVFLLAGYTNRSLFCNSRDLAESIENETPFCVLQGLMFYYAGLVLVIFWLFHILIIFWGIVFPFHAKNFERKGYFKYIHIIMAVAGISLPWASVGAIVGTGNLTAPQVPPFVCLAMNTDANIYLFLLPLSVMTATGISLITIILWVIITKIHSGGIGKAKLKLLIIFFYFTILSIMSLTNFTITVQNVTEIISELTAYFICESQGIQPGRTCERQTQNRAIQIIVFILLGLYPVVNLLYVINFQEVKQFFKRLVRRSNLYFFKTPLASKTSI